MNNRKRAWAILSGTIFWWLLGLGIIHIIAEPEAAGLYVIISVIMLIMGSLLCVIAGCIEDALDYRDRMRRAKMKSEFPRDHREE